MFRKREDDNLFGNDGSTTETTTATAAPAAAAPSAPAAAPARPSVEARPANTATANSFRANASPLGADITRNRMPEAKGGLASSSDKSNKSARRVLTVGNDILLKGEIATCDRLVIEGKVDATLNEVHTVEIAETGSFKGSAHIEDAEISGLFEGDLVVRNRLIIYSTGKVRGKISYGEIEIERGGEMTGEIKATNAQSGSRPSTAQRPVGAKKDEVFAA